MSSSPISGLSDPQTLAYSASKLEPDAFKQFSSSLAQDTSPEQRRQLKESLHTVYRLKADDLEEHGAMKAPSKEAVLRFVELHEQGASHLGNFIEQVKSVNPSPFTEKQETLLKRLQGQISQTFSNRKKLSSEIKAQEIYSETLFALTGSFPARDVTKKVA